MARRHVLQILAALGLGGPVAVDVAAQAVPTVSAAVLEQAATLLGGGFDAARLEVAGRAVRRNLDHLQVVRELDLDDAVEPPTLFRARRETAHAERGQANAAAGEVAPLHQARRVEAEPR
ncbi:MAG: hypothetical protein AB7I23_09015 [Vicinamibacterales bacterium]